MEYYRNLFIEWTDVEKTIKAAVTRLNEEIEYSSIYEKVDEKIFTFRSGLKVATVRVQKKDKEMVSLFPKQDEFTDLAEKICDEVVNVLADGNSDESESAAYNRLIQFLPIFDDRNQQRLQDYYDSATERIQDKEPNTHLFILDVTEAALLKYLTIEKGIHYTGGRVRQYFSKGKGNYDSFFSPDFDFSSGIKYCLRDEYKEIIKEENEILLIEKLASNFFCFLEYCNTFFRYDTNNPMAQEITLFTDFIYSFAVIFDQLQQ